MFFTPSNLIERFGFFTSSMAKYLTAALFNTHNARIQSYDFERPAKVSCKKAMKNLPFQ